MKKYQVLPLHPVTGYVRSGGFFLALLVFSAFGLMAQSAGSGEITGTVGTLREPWFRVPQS